MSYKTENIVHENGKHWVLKIKSGFEVYKVGITHSIRCAQIGWTGQKGLDIAIAECARREKAGE